MSYARKSSSYISKEIYFPRVIASLMGFTVVVVTVNQLQLSSNYYVGAFFQGFIWPHLAYFYSKSVPDSYQAERRNMMLDSFFGAFWVVVMQFNPVASMALISALVMNNACAGGFRLIAEGGVAKLAGLTFGVIFCGVQYTGLFNEAILLAAAPIFLIYPMALGNTSYRNSIALYQQKRAYARLSRHDGLTHLYNRGYWQEQLEHAFFHYQRYQQSASLILLDVDFFKKINDAYGHSTGDEVLRRLSILIQDNLREVDLAGRYGGEEFAIILPQTDATSAKKVAERIRVDIAKTLIEYQGSQVHFTASFGVAEIDETIETPEQWLTFADKALYKSKESGRNQTTIWPLESLENKLMAMVEMA